MTPGWRNSATVPPRKPCQTTVALLHCCMAWGAQDILINPPFMEARMAPGWGGDHHWPLPASPTSPTSPTFWAAPGSQGVGEAGGLTGFTDFTYFTYLLATPGSQRVGEAGGLAGFTDFTYFTYLLGCPWQPAGR